MKGIIFAGDRILVIKYTPRYSASVCVHGWGWETRPWRILHTKIGKGLYGPKKLHRLTSVFEDAARH